MFSSRRGGVAWLLVLALAGCDDGRTMMVVPDGMVPVGADAGPGGASDGGGMTTPPPSGCPAPAPAACVVIEAAGPMPIGMRGATVSGSDDFGGSRCGVGSGGGMGGTGARDLAFRFTAPEAGLYAIDTVGSSFDTLLSIRTDCGGEELACNDDIARGQVQSQVEVTLAACQTVLIIVDGYNADAAGDVVLNIGTRETICDDGIDNDGDGLIDCDDPDCFSVECSGGDDWPPDWRGFEWEVLTETNRFRASGYNCDSRGSFGPAPALEMNATIQVAARGHSLDMGQMDYFEHDSLDGRTFDVRMQNAGFRGPSPWGENIAAGQRTARDVVQGWMESDGHCANIMNPRFLVIGIGYAYVEGSRFGHYWTQNFAAGH